ncbi:RelA/SpoT domain-containing protein [Duganella vulcania]|uniref:RelA/SpoT domain-containing protein n=1 Tax=Duganella vulcania TaxID=2692166 RepID=A0A845GX05_9BURK|nr:hypothetical protein [Duganella vulcania]MYM97900.1 hypothetical protein [Duganella vulcania]
MLQFDLDVFLAQNRVTLEDWQSSDISWEDLLLIGQDHEEQQAALEASAILNASLIQRFNGVHSVRWRVKDTSHLMAKIIRKRAAKAPKYMDISAANYMEVIDDLIGLRALHLFKDDCFEIDREVRAVFPLKEKPIAYIREGDNPALTTQYQAAGMTVEKHKDNYRSIHYILTTKPTLRVVNIELQVRTIFEEGWSEIDHKVRYPNFPNNQLLRGILNVLNGMTGQADDTGGLIQKLSQELRLGIGETHGSGPSDNKIDNISDFSVDEVTEVEHPPAGVDAGTLPADVSSSKAEGQPEQPIDPTPRQSAALDVTYKTMSERNAVMRALRDFKEAGAVVKAMNDHNAAMKALRGFDEVGAATKAMNEHNEAMRALRGFDEVGAVAKALKEHNATMNAFKGYSGVSAVANALNEHDVARRLVDDQSAAKRLLDDHNAVKRILDDQSAAKRLLEDHNTINKALEEHNTVKRYLDEQELIRNALKR